MILVWMCIIWVVHRKNRQRNGFFCCKCSEATFAGDGRFAPLAAFLALSQKQHEIEGFQGQRLGQELGLFVNLLGDGHAFLRLSGRMGGT